MSWRDAEKVLDRPEKRDPLAMLQREHAAEVASLKASLMVLDATIYMLVPGLRPEWADMFKGQIAAAKEAYEHATGEESMIEFTRNQPTEKPCPTPRS